MSRDTKRLFVNTMRGPLYSVSYDGKTVTPYLDVNAPEWGVPVQSQGTERGVQSIAFHPQFTQRGARGYGKFYTYTDTSNMTPKADFLPSGDPHTHDLVLLEWTAKNPAAATYDGGAPRELFRVAHPFPNHNGGMIGFNPLTPPRESRLRSPLRRLGRRRQRRRPVQPRPEPGVRVRQDPPHRPARDEQRQRQVRHPRDRTRS